MSKHNQTKVKPLGYYCLVRMQEVEQVSKQGIVIASDKELRREKLGQSVGRLLEIGPRAFRGLGNGCDSPEDWGVKEGDLVEFTSYDGKIPKGGEDDSLRLILDQHVIGKVKEG